MKKLIPLQDLLTPKVGDILMYCPTIGYDIENFTFGRKYSIIHTDNDEVTVVNDKGEKRRLGDPLVKGYFRLISKVSDNVNHPPHYTWLKDKCGIEVIDITRHMDFCLGNAIKYILRAGHKQDASLTDNQKEIEDLKKAIWYIKDRIKQLGG